MKLISKIALDTLASKYAPVPTDASSSSPGNAATCVNYSGAQKPSENGDGDGGPLLKRAIEDLLAKLGNGEAKYNSQEEETTYLQPWLDTDALITAYQV